MGAEVLEIKIIAILWDLRKCQTDFKINFGKVNVLVSVLAVHVHTCMYLYY